MLNLAASSTGENPLFPTWPEFIIGTVVFLIVFGLLARMLLPRIQQTLAERTELIEGGLARSEEAQAEAKEMLDRYRDSIRRNLRWMQHRLRWIRSMLRCANRKCSCITTKWWRRWGGIVGDIPVRVGDRVQVTTQLTTVDKPGSLEVYVYVPIEHSSQLKMNLPVQVLNGDGKVVADSRISFISPEVDNTTQTVLVKARIANSNDALRQSQFIRARIVWGVHQSPQVPILAVSRLAGQYFAFVAEPQTGGSYVARQRALKIGQTVGNDYEVQDGIKPGDKVIVSGTQFLLDGAPVIPHS